MINSENNVTDITVAGETDRT